MGKRRSGDSGNDCSSPVVTRQLREDKAKIIGQSMPRVRKRQ